MREAAIDCLQELYQVMGESLLDVIRRQQLRPAALREVVLRLDAVAPTNLVVPSVSETTARRQALDTDFACSEAQSSGLQDSLSQQYGSSSSLNSAGGEREDLSAQLDATARLAGGYRRGGYKDGGGITENGELPPAPIIAPGSDKELRAELDAISSLLATAGTDWQARINAMIRLEGLVKGGAAQYDAFGEHLRGLKEPLVKQLEDRRSAVSRQACHLVASLSSSLSTRFVDYAVYILPALLKVLVITIQVGGALMCTRGLLAGAVVAKAVGHGMPA